MGGAGVRVCGGAGRRRALTSPLGHQLLDGHILKAASLREIARFHPGASWDAYGLGLARDSIDGHTMHGHSGNGIGSHTEFWHLPRQKLTIAITWNDGLLDHEGGILPALLRAALGYSR